MSEINLNDLKNDSLKKVNISDIAEQDEPRGVSKQEVQSSIMGEVDAAASRFVKNFEDDMKEKYEKEAAEKASKENSGELDQFLGDDDNSRDLELIVSDPTLAGGIKSTISMDTIPGEDYDTQEKNVSEDMYTQDKAVIQELPLKTVNRPYPSVPNKQPEEVLGDPTLSLNTDEFVGSVTESEKIDDSDFELILGDKRDVVAEQKALIEDIRNKINPISKPVDLSTLTVSKKPVFVNNALQNQDTDKHVSDWVLFESKQIISMETFSGTQLEKIDSRNYPNRTKYNMFLEVYKNIFKHIVNIKDKSKYIEWLKVLKFFDLNHLWFSVYKTTFEKANIVPYVCKNPKCGHRYVKDIKNILDMVKFKTDKDKDAFDAIFNSLPSVSTLEYEAKQKQITDDLIIEFRDPSVWNVIFENAILPDKFREKYATLLNTISFIDTMYIINRDENGNAIDKSELKFTTYPNDMLKSIMSRIYTYAKMLESLTSDQKITVDSIIIDIHEEHDQVSYVIPQDTCPECGSIIEETPATGEELVFTRQELVGMTLS